ncbi:MAG: 50S ribosomal protein L9 [Ignavibacteriales bacterium]|nr:50S ribosomal protein L9 [Ignavibacteriales bacterium]
MKVILRKDIEQLGQMGQVVDVKNGYARNYLFPRNIAYPATPSSLKMLEEEKKQHVKKADKEKKASETLAAQLEKVSLTVKMKVGEDDKLFGSVTSQLISDGLKEKGISLDKRQIELDDSIKALGVYDVNVKLSGGVSAKVKVWVVRE